MNQAAHKEKSHGGTLKKASARRIFAAASVTLFFATTTSNATTSTWTNTDGNNNYSDANNWSPSGVPNGNTYDIIVGLPSPTNVDITASVNDVTINTGGILNILGNLSYGITGSTAVNNGSIVVDSNQYYSTTLTFGTTTVSGTGTITLNAASTGAQLSTSASNEVTFGSGQTIDGYGTINATAINQGTVNANLAGNTLYISSPVADGAGYSFTNTGTLEATTGTLTINNSATVNNTGGVILANNGNVYLSSVTVSGGSLTSTGTGGIYVDNATLTGGPTVTSGSTVNIEGNTTSIITGATFTDNGHIIVNQDQYYTANLNFNSNTALVGSGTITLNAVGASAAIHTGSGDEITQASTHTIDGFGQILSTMINQGKINADVAGQILYLSSATVDGSGYSVTNTGTIEATTGTLQINSGAKINNSGGTVLGNGGNVQIYNSTINGGTLTSNSGGQFYSDSSLFTGSPTLSSGSTLNIEGNTTTTITSPAFTNNGQIVVNQNQYYSTNLLFTSNTSIGGTGTIDLDSSGATAQIAANSGATVTVGSGQTVLGYGQITAQLVNNGVINGNVNNSSFTLTSNNMSNNNLVEATNGSSLVIAGITFTQSSSALLEANGDGGGSAHTPSTVMINNSTIIGGTLSGTGAGAFYSSSSTLEGSPTLAAGTTLNIDGNTTTNLSGPTFVDNGHIIVNYNQYYTANLTVVDNLTLTGTGLVTLNSTGATAQILTGSGDSLTQAAGHTIDGFGQIGAVFTNNGTVNADSPGNSITLTGNSEINNSIIEATNGGTISVASITVTQGATGVIEASGSNGANNSSVSIANATINGGTLTGTAADSFTLTNSTLTGPMTITGGTLLNVTGNETVSFTGSSITDNGHFVVNSNQYYTGAISINDNTTVDGTGTISLNAAGAAAQIDTGSTFTFTQGASHTIDGYGQIGAKFVNNGAVNADVSGQAIGVVGPTTNNGTFRASNGGTLSVSAGVLSNLTGATLTGGIYEVDANSTMNLNSSGITTLSATVLLNGTGTTFHDLTPLATITSSGVLDLENSATFTTSGALTDNGTIRLGNGTVLTLGGNLSEGADGLLEGDGTVDPPSLSLLGDIEPGAGELTGTLSLEGSTVFGSTTDLLYTLGSPLALTTNSMMDVTGDLTLDGILGVTAASGFSSGTYDLINFSGVLTDNGLQIDSLPSGYSGTIVIVPSVPGVTPGNVDLVVVGVPEPASMGAAALAGVCLLSRRRRR